MKTFKEFVEEAYLYEMRKEDKVKGKLVANDGIAALAQKHEAGLEEIFKMLTH